jgi:hypothetical protein
MFSFTRASVFALVAAAASVSAQIPNNITISKECTSTLFNLAFSPEASACFNAPDLINAGINKTQTLADPLGAATTWINGLCSNGWCSEGVLQSFIQNVTTGCSEDLKAANINIDLTTNTMDNIKTGYRAARDIICLKDTSSGDLCAIDTLKEASQFVQNFLSFNTVLSLFSGGSFDANAGKTFLQTTLIPNLNSACTSCAKAAFSVAKTQFPALVSKADSEVSDVCGDDFVNGQMPAEVQVIAKNASAASLLAKNAAATVFGRVSGVQLGAVVFAAALGLLL